MRYKLRGTWRNRSNHLQKKQNKISEDPGILHMQQRGWNIKLTVTTSMFGNVGLEANASDSMDGLLLNVNIRFSSTCLQRGFYLITSPQKRGTTSNESWSLEWLTAKVQKEVGELTRSWQSWIPLNITLHSAKEGTRDKQVSDRRSSHN